MNPSPTDEIASGCIQNDQVEFLGGLGEDFTHLRPDQRQCKRQGQAGAENGKIGTAGTLEDRGHPG